MIVLSNPFPMNGEASTPSSSNRCGSALIIVLGLLSVLMLMAMAFIIAMRTERGGASNQRHAITARKMLDAAIVRAVADLDDELMGVINVDGKNVLLARPTPPWMIYASTNYASTNPAPASLLSHEAAKYLPPDQRIAARFANPGWLPITGGVSEMNANDAVLGRYAYVILNNAGYLDANLVHSSTTNHFFGSDPREIRIAEPDSSGNRLSAFDYASGLASASQFSTAQQSEGRWVSMSEFMERTEIYGAPPNNALTLKFQTNSFHITSFSKDVLTPFATNGLSGVHPYAIRKPKVLLSTDRLSDLVGFKTEIREAFGQSFTNSLECWQLGANKGSAKNSRNKVLLPTLTESTYSRLDLATAGLLDYLDDDVLPGRNSAGNSYYEPGVDWSDRPCTEPVPMFSQFRVHQFNDGAVKYQCVTNFAGDPLVPVSYTYTIPMEMYARTVFLNRTIPPASAQDFTIKFNVSEVLTLNQAKEPDGTDPFAAPVVSPATKAAFQLALMQFLGQFNPEQTATHNPSSSRTGGIQYRPANPLTFTWPVKTSTGTPEAPFPSKVTFYLRIRAEVALGSDPVQWVPGKSYRNDDRKKDHSLQIGVTLDLKEIAKSKPDTLIGWAFVADPRFGYDGNGDLITGSGSGYFSNIWMTGDRAKQMALDPNLEPKLKAWITTMETYNAGPAELNEYMKFILKGSTPADLTATGSSVGLGLADWTDGHYAETTASDYVSNGESPNNSILYMVRNGQPKSVGELGNLVVAPYRTISLFDSRMPPDPTIIIPRHTVLDWFTIGSTNQNRVNLNSPFTASIPSATGSRTEVVSNVYRNYEPLTAVFAGLPLNELATGPIVNPKRVPWSDAIELAKTLVDYTLRWEQQPSAPNDRLKLGYNRNGLAYDLSILGRVPPLNPGSSTPAHQGILHRILGTGDTKHDPECDFEREALIRNSVELLTTRQQIYTIVIRADAFTPRFGFDNAEKGTTLASALAIVEIWRDSEPVRNADGAARIIPTSEFATRKVKYIGPSGQEDFSYSTGQHEWFIRYLHQF